MRQACAPDAQRGAGDDRMATHSSLPFGGGPVYVAVFWATFFLWQGAEWLLKATRRSGSTEERRDRGSFPLLSLAIGTAFTLDFAAALLLPAASIASAARTAFALGIGCVVAGAALRWSAVLTLGRYFTVDVAAHAAQPVIDVGPYRRIRHPAYAGTLLTLIGFGLALGNWAGLLAMAIIPGAAFAYRIAVEEAALLSTLGEPYARYMHRTRRLIPYLI
jgi:protein-S-isoprenylcysteine O-methyltransferase Ste14